MIVHQFHQTADETIWSGKMSSINWIQSPVALTKNIPGVIFTSMYLGLTFASFEILGTDTGTCSADWWIDGLSACLGFRLMYSVISHEPMQEVQNQRCFIVHHLVQISNDVYLESISASVTCTSEESEIYRS